MMNIAEGLNLDINSFVGKSTAVLGITGSGKTNTAAVLIEELLANGLPLTIVDIEGEYWGLKEKFEILVAGRSEHAELAIGPENAAALARVSVERGISVILDLSDYTQEEMYSFLIEYFTALWGACSKAKRPYQIILEEAHEFVPQGTTTPLKQIITRIALRGRKRGLGIILASQRSAKVEKDVLTQTALLFLHKVMHPTDTRVYCDLVPLPTKEVEAMIAGLQVGEAIIVSNHVPQVAHIRLRHTFDAGATPEFGAIAQPELRAIDAALLRELQSMLASSAKSAAKDDNKLKKHAQELEALLVEKDAIIREQAKQIEMLSRLTVSMNGKIQTDVSLPDTMHIGHATVQEMHVPRIQSNATTVVESVPVQKQQRKIVTVPVNEAKVKTLHNRLNTLSQRQYEIFKLLVERNQAMTVEEIGAWLNLARSTTQRNLPPPAFFKIGLMSRSKHGNGFIYKANLKEHIKKEFPGVDIEALVGRILK